MSSSYRIWVEVLASMDRVDGLIAETENLRALHEALAGELRSLQSGLFELIPQTTAYQLLFALVVTLDERVLTATSEAPVRWALLQEAFFEIDDGGSRFYQELDRLLVTPNTDPLVFELYTWCIRSGFRGIYGEAPDQLDAVLLRLASRHRGPDGDLAPAPPPPSAYAREERSPAWLYAAALGVILVIYLALNLAPDLTSDLGHAAQGLLLAPLAWRIRRG